MYRDGGRGLLPDQKRAGCGESRQVISPHRRTTWCEAGNDGSRVLNLDCVLLPARTQSDVSRLRRQQL